MSEYLNQDHCNGDFPLCAANVKPIFTVKQLNLRGYAQICPEIIKSSAKEQQLDFQTHVICWIVVSQETSGAKTSTSDLLRAM